MLARAVSSYHPWGYKDTGKDVGKVYAMVEALKQYKCIAVETSAELEACRTSNLEGKCKGSEGDQG